MSTAEWSASQDLDDRVSMEADLQVLLNAAEVLEASGTAWMPLQELEGRLRAFVPPGVAFRWYEEQVAARQAAPAASNASQVLQGQCGLVRAALAQAQGLDRRSAAGGVLEVRLHA